MPGTGASDAVARGTQNSPLPPSVETAYYRKCIELKRRINEIEESNDAARVRKIRVNRQILKMRLERAFLLEQLQKRMEFNVDDSDRSTSPPPTPQEKPLRSKRGHRKTTPPPAGNPSATNLETPGSTAVPGSVPPGQGYFDANSGGQASLPPPQLTPGQSQPSASPYPPIQPQPIQSSPSAPPSSTLTNGQTQATDPKAETQHDATGDRNGRDPENPELEGETRANGATASGSSTNPGAATASSPTPQNPAGADNGAAGGFTAVNQ